MTDERAINTLNSIKQYYNDKNEDSYVGFDNEDNEALDMAIKALEQQLRDCKTCKHSDNGNCAGTEECHECMWESKYEQQPCKDCISRTALLSRIDAERKHLLDIKMDGAEHVIVHHARRIIEDMPSVTPKARWIPVSEEPKETGSYITTIKYGDIYAVGQRYYHGKYVGWEDSCVIAYMPLPNPYAESEDKK